MAAGVDVGAPGRGGGSACSESSRGRRRRGAAAAGSGRWRRGAAGARAGDTAGTGAFVVDRLGRASPIGITLSTATRMTRAAVV